MRFLWPLLLVLLVPASWALEENERVKRAVDAGHVRPLEEILDQLGDRLDGRLLDAELVGRPPSMRYRLKLLDGGDRVREVVVDGQSGGILKGD